MVSLRKVVFAFLSPSSANLAYGASVHKKYVIIRIFYNHLFLSANYVFVMYMLLFVRF